MKKYLLTLLACLTIAPAHAADDEAFWDLLKGGGQIVLMRHAQTDPGIGDPPAFPLADCATQRNLSALGRADAVRIGARFRQQAIRVAEVMSSHWCRCMDTARLAFGKVAPADMLDSVFDERAPATVDKTNALIAWLARHPRAAGRGNVVLITHAVNIHALTGVSLNSGEMLVATLDGRRRLKVLARGTPGH
ncbi:histidine phosphatase family protein [Massilia pseudoviolaceinigra]|uniref:histidine phosphatase family protein n=1 Tax=Massilia pseudoviolaceinigra TaxID=3057165 RepID=UPI002796E226|nr:histidine phosphatase family protein [Massilia sp. CCM 9206]MDQ1923229.1 histidine phosphatase family protein [Massilia sp. CCM 9206]